MKILAIDSSGMTATVALTQDSTLVAEYSVTWKKTHSQTLLPMLDEIRKMTQLDLESIDYIAVAGGPGSFTGLRIGSATAKGIGLALDKPLIHVPTLEGLAWNLWGTQDLICPMMDARRNQVYTGIYAFDPEFTVLVDQCAVPVEEILEKACELTQKLGKGIVFLGDGVPVYEREIRETVDLPYRLAPAHMNLQRAASVAACAAVYAKAGRVETAAAHRPDYLRVSQAERERAERLRAEKEDAGKNSPEIIIRPMKAEDIGEVAAIEKELFSVPWSEESFLSFLNLPDAKYLAARADGKIVGYCGLLRSFEDADITNVAVTAQYQRRGIGKKLLCTMMEEGEEEGIRRWMLEVRKSNIPAISLYEGLGFSRAGCRQGYYEKPREDALILCLDKTETDN